MRISSDTDKCAAVEVKKTNIILFDVQTISNPGEEVKYKYLVIQQTYETKHQEAKKVAGTEFIMLVRKIFSTQISAKNKMISFKILSHILLEFLRGRTQILKKKNN